MPNALVIEAYQGIDLAQTVQASDSAGSPLTGFAGSELLASVVWSGADATPATTTVPTWVSGPDGTISFTLSGSTLVSIPAGVYETVITLADDSRVLRRFYLSVLPGPGTSSYRSLATLADCQIFVPDLFRASTSFDALPAALEAATLAIEGYCQRPLVLTDYDRLYRPGRTRRIQLHAWPVPTLTRIQADLATMVTINCSSTVSKIATIRMVPTSQTSNSLSSLVLTWFANGFSSNATLDIPSYPTMAELVAGINGIGDGWSAQAMSPYSDWPTSELNANPGTYGAISGTELQGFTRDVGRYTLDPINGIVELTENRPQGFRYPDRAYGSYYGVGFGGYGNSDPRFANVRVRYRAGYATDSADIALGYEPVPADLRQACVMTAQSIVESAPASGPVIEQAVKDRSYKLRDTHSAIPETARVILGRYINKRLF